VTTVPAFVVRTAAARTAVGTTVGVPTSPGRVAQSCQGCGLVDWGGPQSAGPVDRERDHEPLPRNRPHRRRGVNDPRVVVVKAAPCVGCDPAACTVDRTLGVGWQAGYSSDLSASTVRLDGPVKVSAGPETVVQTTTSK